MIAVEIKACSVPKYLVSYGSCHLEELQAHLINRKDAVCSRNARFIGQYARKMRGCWSLVGTLHERPLEFCHF